MPIREAPSTRQIQVALDAFNDRFLKAVRRLRAESGDYQPGTKLGSRLDRVKRCSVSYAIRQGEEPTRARNRASGHSWTARCGGTECPACLIWKARSKNSVLTEKAEAIIDRCQFVQQVRLTHCRLLCAETDVATIRAAVKRLKTRMDSFEPALTQHFHGAFIRWEISEWWMKRGSGHRGGDRSARMAVNLHVHVVGQPRFELVSRRAGEGRLAIARLEAAWAATREDDESKAVRVGPILLASKAASQWFKYLHGIKIIDKQPVPKMLVSLVRAAKSRRAGSAIPQTVGIQPEQIALILAWHCEPKPRDIWKGAWSAGATRRRRRLHV